ncbi:MAG: protein arginine kinase [Planctomycetes bacterium]|nr:protein arginine kinase [Planctomycetota bacterium]
MKLADLPKNDCQWLRGVGPMHDVVISSRVRLARNIAGMPFLTKCSPQQQQDLEALLRKTLLEAQLAPEMLYVDVQQACELDRQLLLERHLMSKPHAKAEHPRGLAVSADETAAIMVNEEDHLRMQVLRSGLQIEQAVEQIARIDEKLEARLDFAFHSRYGYLTACPTNVGTGLRISTMLHLVALKLTGEIEKAFRAARDLHLAVRGFHGEGTEAVGDLFQVSNQTTLGRSEQQIVEEFCTQIIPQFIRYERLARTSLFKRNALAIEDKICRSLAMLRSARLISSAETLYHLSLVRMGVHAEVIKDVDLKTLNALFLMIQPAHLQKVRGQEIDSVTRAVVRAEYLRKTLGGN